LILFFLPAALESSTQSNSSFFPSTVPGGIGFVTYSSMFAQLFSLKALANHSMQPPPSGG
jgi:hypothetical protein